MDILSLLFAIWICGAIGFLIGSMLPPLPKTREKLEFVLLSAAFWPKALWHLYEKSLEQEARSDYSKLYAELSKEQAITVHLGNRARKLQRELDEQKQINRDLMRTNTIQYTHLLEKHNKIKEAHEKLQHQLDCNKPAIILPYQQKRKDNE